MKKLVLLLAALVLISGCTPKAPEATATPDPSASPVVDTMYKAGVASSTVINDKGDFSSSIDTTMAAVVVDETGKIVYVYFDVVENVAYFNDQGMVTAEKTIVMPSKKVAKDDYGMKNYSEIKKEWYEQAEAFEMSLIGKTIPEALGIEIVDDKITDKDIMTSVSIKVSPYLAALEKASQALVDVKPAATYGFANTSSMTPTDATADKIGSVEFSTTYNLVGLSTEDKVEFSLIDTAQNKVFFDAKGMIDAAKSVEMKTKKEAGADYGMKKYSPIGKEWNEQIAAVEQLMVGKTVAEVLALPKDEKGYFTGTDVISSVTINVYGYLSTFELAVANKR